MHCELAAFNRGPRQSGELVISHSRRSASIRLPLVVVWGWIGSEYSEAPLNEASADRLTTAQNINLNKTAFSNARFCVPRLRFGLSFGLLRKSLRQSRWFHPQEAELTSADWRYPDLAAAEWNSAVDAGRADIPADALQRD